MVLPSEASSVWPAVTRLDNQRPTMIPSRRGILLGLCSSAWAVLSCRGPHEKGLRPRAASERSGRLTEGDAFLRQFEGNRRRAYSEEGVAVYLVGENLAAGSTDGGHKPLAPSKWNRQFANRLR